MRVATINDGVPNQGKPYIDIHRYYNIINIL